MIERLSRKRKWDNSEMESAAESTTYCSDVFCQTEPLFGERWSGLVSAGASALALTLSFPKDMNVGWVHPQSGHERIRSEWASFIFHYSDIFQAIFSERLANKCKENWNKKSHNGASYTVFCATVWAPSVSASLSANKTSWECVYSLFLSYCLQIPDNHWHVGTSCILASNSIAFHFLTDKLGAHRGSLIITGYYEFKSFWLSWLKEEGKSRRSRRSRSQMCALYGVCYSVCVPDARIVCNKHARITVLWSLLSGPQQRWGCLVALVFCITAPLWGFLSSVACGNWRAFLRQRGVTHPQTPPPSCSFHASVFLSVISSHSLPPPPLLCSSGCHSVVNQFHLVCFNIFIQS